MNVFTILATVSTVSLITACNQPSEQPGIPQKVFVSEPPFPVSDESYNLFTHPVTFDTELGVATAKLGKDKIFQVDATLVEIPPGGQIPPVRHLAEEIIYIVSGSGYSTMWVRPGDQPHRYEWSAGDLLLPSLNTWHQHFNTSPDIPARYVSITSTPLMINQFYDETFTTGIDYIFENRWQMGITQQPKYKIPNSMDMMAGHHFPNVKSMALQEVEGRWGFNLRPDEGDMVGNRLMEIFVREYRSNEMGIPSDGDKHPWEKIYLALEGEGSAVLKNGGEPARVVNWQSGDLFVVNANEHHDMGPRFGDNPEPPYTRLMQVKAPGYFDRIGNVGGTLRTYVTEDDELIVEYEE